MDNLRTLGLDLSLSRTGAVVYDGDRAVDYLSIQTKPETPMEERFHDISTQVVRLWKRTKPAIALYDKGTKSKFTDDRAYQLLGVVRWRLWRRNCLMIPVASNTMLKEFTGNGGGTSAERKTRILEAVQDVWPECPNHDVADAYGFAHLGWHKAESFFDTVV